MSQYPASVIDDDGNVHHLLKTPLGRGGQGVVFRTRSPHVVVKLIEIPASVAGDAPRPARGGSAQRLWTRLTSVGGSGPLVDEAKRQSLRRRLENVHLLPLPDLQLARPLSMLRDHVGYTMRLLTGMVPIRTLLAEPGTKDLAGFYQTTGGVARRLRLLANTASLLARLHAIPLVYADVSPNNVFVSESGDASEVWFIDLDNLDHLSTHGPSIYTPGFGAPEIVAGRSGVTTLSDAFSFAILAFYVLAQVHPFLGNYVEEGGWDDDEDREQLAFHGEVPWIEDPDDDSNRSDHGIPRDLVLSGPLRDLFQRTFGRGRAQRLERPGMVEWADALRLAADCVVSCPGCKSSFDISAKTCHFCNSGVQPGFVHLEVHRWDPEADESEASAVHSHAVWHRMIDAGSDGVVLRHVVEPVLAASPDPPALRVRFIRQEISIEPLDGREILVVKGGQIQRLEGETRFRLPTQGHEIYLHFGPIDRPHRLAALRYYPESR